MYGHSHSHGVPGDHGLKGRLPIAWPQQGDHAVHFERAERTLRAGPTNRLHRSVARVRLLDRAS